MGCNILPEDLNGIKKLRHLVSLDLTASLFTDECLAIVADCNSIEYLSLKYHKFSNNSGLIMISKLKKIRVLNLSYCNIQDKILDFFINHPSIEKIIIEKACLNEDDTKLIDTKTRGLPQIVGTYSKKYK